MPAVHHRARPRGRRFSLQSLPPRSGDARLDQYRPAPLLPSATAARADAPVHRAPTACRLRPTSTNPWTSLAQKRARRRRASPRSRWSFTGSSPRCRRQSKPMRDRRSRPCCLMTTKWTTARPRQWRRRTMTSGRNWAPGNRPRALSSTQMSSSDPQFRRARELTLWSVPTTEQKRFSSRRGTRVSLPSSRAAFLVVEPRSPQGKKRLPARR